MSEGSLPRPDDLGSEDRGPKGEHGDSPKLRGKVQKNHPREAHEHYVEEGWVSLRLLQARDFGPVIVDPCAGFGNVVASARALGLCAWGSDLAARAPGIAGGRDFLSHRWRAPANLQKRGFAIVGNPPFGTAAGDLVRAFAELAVKRASRVALLTHVERLNALLKWALPLGLAEVLTVEPRPSMWPGRIYAKKLEQGVPLGTGRRNVVWLLFDGCPRESCALGRLRKEG